MSSYLYRTDDIKLNIIFSSNSNQWILYYRNEQNELTINELANYCWKNNMDISLLLRNIFNKVQTSINQKLQNFKGLDEAYNNRLRVIREGNHALNSLLDSDLLDKLKLKQGDDSEINIE